MKSKICLTLLITIAFTQLVAVEKEEEVHIDLERIEKEDSTPTTNTHSKHLTKIYEVDEEALNLLFKRFKNVVYLVYASDEEENQTNSLNEILLKFELEKNDLVFVKMEQSKTQLAKGIHLQHLQKSHYFDNFSNLYEKLKSVVAPELQFLDSEQAVNEYFSQNEKKNNALVLLSQEYHLFDLVKTQIESIIADGTFEEAHIDNIIAYNGTYKNYETPTLLLSTADGRLEHYEYNMTYNDQIIDFLYLESLPILIELTEDTYARVFGGSVLVQVHLLIDKYDEKLMNEFRYVAMQNKETELKYKRILFTYSTYEQNQEFWNTFDFTNKTKTPQVVLTEINFRKYQLLKYICESEDLNRETIQQFIDQFRLRDIQEYFRSEEPINEQNEINAIQKIVGKTFTDKIIKRSQNILLLYWDSKDPQASEDHFTLLSEFLAATKLKNLQVASIDLALNEHPKIIIDSAPKLVLYLTADRKPKEYLKSSRLNFEDLTNWLNYYLGEGVGYQIDL